MDLSSIYDVVVVGGGISGSMAALAAAREGVKTLIIEQHGCLGGMLTVAGIGPMMTFHAGSTQVIRGITDELINRMAARKKSPGHIFDTTGYTFTVTPFDAEAMKYELDEMMDESGVDVLFHTMLAGVKCEDSVIKDIQVCNKGGLSNLRAKVFVDATGDGDLSAWAGVPFAKGRAADGKSQPLTMKMKMIKVDTLKLRRYIKNNPLEFPSLHGNTSIIDRAERLSIGGFTRLVERAKAQGKFNIARNSILMFETNNPGEFIINTSRIHDHDATDPVSLSDAEMLGRKQVKELERFLIDFVPGFENAVLEYSGPNIGIRASRHISGIYCLTEQDVLSFKIFNDTIACAAYPIDIHPGANETFEDQSSKFKSGRYYTIPYRCLVNKNVGNLITVGRCISTTFEAQAAMRTTPTVAAIGQAGGVAASIAALRNIIAAKVPFNELKDKLLRQGAFLP